MKPRFAIALLALALACTAPQRPAPAPAPAATTGAPAPPANRDKHGNPDISGYIQVLQSESRVSDLQIDLVVSKLALPRDAVVGDLGCGPGLFSVAFARACPAGVVYACDIEPAQLDQVRERIHEEHLENIVP